MNRYLTRSANNASMHNEIERAWVEIDLGALQQNGATIARLARVPLIPMVKADAYGLGVIPVVRTLESLDPWGYGVATADEGVELRAAGISRPIIVFTPSLDAEHESIAEHGLTPALSSESQIRAWSARGLPWQLSIDTGMSRAGVPWREVASLSTVLSDHKPQGVFTHFHSAQLQDGSLEEQLARFDEAVAAIPDRPDFIHAEASAAIVRCAPSKWSVVRPGIFLYGVGSGAEPEPAPVVHLRATIVDIRTLEAGDTVSYDATFVAGTRMRIATVAAGYADGYPRALSNRSSGLLNGETVRITGRVTMDMTMFDVTGADCKVGDVITLIGTGGSRTITIQQIADWADMSPYEVLTGLRNRIKRVYK
ncbi:MAG: alanine racemase [Gemmatimonadaceae bacterium]|nr:alanine racemase [Gemmatimonadaceae bacterium]